jgi:hypothetical protein
MTAPVVTITDDDPTPGIALTGSTITYTITVTNPLPDPFGDFMTVSFPGFDGEVGFSNISWGVSTASPPIGLMSISATSGTGPLNDVVELAPNGQVTFVVKGTIESGAPLNLENPVTVTDNIGDTFTATDPQFIAAPPIFTPVPTQTDTLGVPSQSFTVQATDFVFFDTGPILLESGLPDGLNFVDNGDGTATVSGTPIGATGDFHVTLIATDPDVGLSSTQTFEIIVDPATPAPMIAGTDPTPQQSSAPFINPFGGATIIDAKGQNETVTITGFDGHSNSPLNKLLIDPSAATDGGHFTHGAYIFTGSAAAVTNDLQALEFLPTTHAMQLTVSVTDAAGETVTDNTTSILGISNVHHHV